MTSRVRRARGADLPSIAALDREASPVYDGAGAYRRFLEPDGLLLVAGTDGAIAGFVALRRVLDEAEVINIAVASWARRRGAGRALLEGAAQVAAGEGVRRLLLDVRESNDAARALYRGCRFREDGRRPAYYPPDGLRSGEREAAILMSRDLPARNGETV